MTHIDSRIKSSKQTSPVATRQDFLTALYPDVDSALYFELRCIHPTTSKARVLWSATGGEKRQASIFKQADALNKSGHSLYFAPCLRSEKKGSASAAKVVPALWVDIDCVADSSKKQEALAKLHAFNQPSSIVVDSGGGWHAYWLLEAPHLLETDEERQHIADILQGLFVQVGGDEDYAKSVASLMRLPDSINTKPDRNGAIATITEFCTDRRYALSDFEWLVPKTPPKVKVKSILPALNGNGHAPLPKVTLDYLSTGATNGNRNRALFDAACQFRDAGYSQIEAEAQLVTRHVTDGAGDENPTTRETEAKATIASAYRETPRDPIQTAKSSAQDLVNQLVNHVEVEEKKKQLNPEQISEAVKACAHLDAVEWAIQRQKLKALCTNGLRVSDLDRQYRQARKELEQAAQADVEDSEEYFEEDGCIIYRYVTQRGPSDKTVVNWTGRIIERISQVNDDGQVEHLAKLELDHDGRISTLQVPSEMFGDDAALRRFIAGKAGEAFTVRAGMGRHLAPAIISLSGAYPHRTCYRFMGWTKIDERWTYVAPGLCINADGIVEDPPEIELDTRLRDYRLENTTWEDSLKAFEAMTKVFPKELASACISFALLPLLQGFFPSAAPRPAIHLAGTYGSGKSELAALMSSFYGTFSRDTPPAQWGDTINTVEAIGHPLASALYWVDDYKSIYADERTFTRFLQSYSRGMGRGRLTREAKVRHERPCRGLILSTGETVLEGEASVLSRMLVLDIPPWEKRDPQGEALAEADSLRHLLSGFTVRFAHWIAQQAENNELSKRLSHEFGVSVQGYRNKLKASGISMSNTGRVVQNWAVLVTTYRMLQSFMEAHDVFDLLPIWQDNILQTAQTVREERAGEIFLNSLSQLLASGDVMLAKNMKNPEEPRPGVTLVGYRDQQYVYLLPEVAFKEASRIQTLRFNVSAIGSQLKEDGYLVTGNSNNHLTVQMRIRDNRVRLWRLKAEILSGDNGDGGDTAQH